MVQSNGVKQESLPSVGISNSKLNLHWKDLEMLLMCKKTLMMNDKKNPLMETVVFKLLVWFAFLNVYKEDNR